MRKFLKGLVVGLVAVVVLAAVVVVAVYLVSNARFNTTYAFTPAGVAVPSDSAALAHGRHVATIRGCVECHGENLGGKLFLDAGPVAKLYSSNLTAGQGGVGGVYDDVDWVRAIRHGIGPDGKPLLFMPSHEFFPLSDEDTGALIAYLKTVPLVDNTLPASEVGPLGRVLYLAGQLPLVPAELIEHDADRPAPPPAGATAAYGEYLAVTCTGCHGPTFSGGPIPGTPPEWPAAANITPDAETGIGGWTEADFFRALREGKRLDGTQIDPAFMPWRVLGNMTDDEIRAIWLYLQTLPARPEGGR